MEWGLNIHACTTCVMHIFVWYVISLFCINMIEYTTRLDGLYCMMKIDEIHITQLWTTEITSFQEEARLLLWRCFDPMMWTKGCPTSTVTVGKALENSSCPSPQSLSNKRLSKYDGNPNPQHPSTISWNILDGFLATNTKSSPHLSMAAVADRPQIVEHPTELQALAQDMSRRKSQDMSGFSWWQKICAAWQFQFENKSKKNCCIVFLLVRNIACCWLTLNLTVDRLTVDTFQTHESSQICNYSARGGDF